MKYLAKEIITAAGKNPDEVIGKVSCNIGGVVVNRPDHILNLQDAKSVEVIVANEKITVDLSATTESDDLKTAVKQKGEAATAAIAERKGGQEVDESAEAQS